MRTVSTSNAPTLGLPTLPGFPAFQVVPIRTELDTHTHTLNTRSSVGVIFYF
jgi:hypothetical protein